MSTITKWNLAVVFPTILIFIAIWGTRNSSHNQLNLPAIRKWALVDPREEIANPIFGAIPQFQKNGGMLLETEVEPQVVRAILSGEIVEVGENTVKLSLNFYPRAIRYEGIDDIHVKKGMFVIAGEKIGIVKPHGPPGTVRLRLSIENK